MSTLFSIETDTVTCAWGRRRRKPVPVVPTGEVDAPFGLMVQGLWPGEPPVVHVHAAEDDQHLFEQTDYTLFVQSRETPIAVRHRDPVLLRGLHRSADGRVVHGTVNFGAQVGRSRFVVEVGGRPAVAFEVEVFPSKLDYRTDYAALRDDVEAIARELALSYLRATYAPGWEGPPDAPGDVAWALLLKHVAADLEAALGYVSRQPQWGLHRRIEPVRTGRIRRPDAAVRRAVSHGRGSGAWQWLGGLPARAYLPAAQSRYTLDTPAHRWLAARLDHIRMRLAEIRDAEAHRPDTPRRRRIREELDALQQRLVRLGRLSVFQDAEGEPPPEPPLLLLTAPGYREAYQACLRLQQGLHLDGGPLHLGLKHLHLLYEYWCYLTLVRQVARLVGHEAPLHTLITVERRGLRLRLQKGRVQTVTFPLDGGRRIDLTYNPRFGGKGYLVPQQPDVLLTLHRPGSVLRYVFDAKYRLDASPGYRRRYGMPGPPRDALNTLHRYRDAIRERSGTQSVVQAIALFPFREEETGQFDQSRLHHVLGEIGIGALPLLPGATHHLDGWLRGVTGVL